MSTPNVQVARSSAAIRGQTLPIGTGGVIDLDQ